MKHRARTDEQKQNRRQLILDTAWEAYQTMPYAAITVASIASAAGLAKGTVFLYFSTKEELFLAVEEQQLDEWFVAVDALLRELRACDDHALIARLVCQSLNERPAMLSLFTILHVILERNISREAAQRFKNWLLERIGATAALLEACLPTLLPGAGLRLFLWIYALIIGLRQITDPAPPIREAIQSDPALAVFDLDFCGECVAAMTALLAGMQKLSDQGASHE